MKDVLGILKTSDFIEELPPGLKSSVTTLEKRGFTYEQIGLEMSKNPSFGLAAKGGDKWNEDLFSKIMDELRIMLCTEDSKYAELRNKLSEEVNVSAKVITALISGWVGNTLGVAEAICVPFVILVVASILRVGLSVFCGVKKE